MDISVRSLSSPDPLANPILHRELIKHYLVFDAFVAGERRVDLCPLVLPDALHADAVNAATGVARAIGRAAAKAHTDPDEAARYGFHTDVLRLARASHEAGDDAGLFRVDLLLGEDGVWRVCEINADCPGGHNEAVGLPRLCRAAGFSEGDDPTTLLDALADRLAALAERTSRRGAVALIYATAYAEDLQVCAFIKRALTRRGVRAVLCPPTAPRPGVDGMYVGDTPVSVLYRFFPTEYMEGQRNLSAIADAVRRGSLRTLSSFAHIFCQSKLAMARALAPDVNATLAPDDRARLARHLPETHDLAEISRDELIAGREQWVIKKALSRVGDEVFVGSLITEASWAPLVDEVLGLRAAGESWIVQRFVRQRAVSTPYGERLVTLGAYVLDGAFVGYFARISPESHVSHDALCIPVFTEKEPRRCG